MRKGNSTHTTILSSKGKENTPLGLPLQELRHCFQKVASTKAHQAPDSQTLHPTVSVVLTPHLPEGTGTCAEDQNIRFTREASLCKDSAYPQHTKQAQSIRLKYQSACKHPHFG